MKKNDISQSIAFLRSMTVTTRKLIAVAAAGLLLAATPAAWAAALALFTTIAFLVSKSPSFTTAYTMKFKRWTIVIAGVSVAALCIVPLSHAGNDAQRSVRHQPNINNISPEWANREVFALNREPSHAFTHRFPNRETALPEPDWANPFNPEVYRMLNGTWKFMWVENPKSVPSDFYKAGFDVKNWDDITVPMPWQIAGYGQLYYFNTGLPMIGDPRNGKESAEGGGLDLVNMKGSRNQRESAKEGWVPTVFNPVGCYVTQFELPGNWEKDRVVLHFSGVQSAFYCWVNGEFAGYSQDSFTPAEFDVTTLLKHGQNRLAVQVIRWSDGTYMENQDMIRMSGIIRDVYLFRTPKTYVSDFFLIPTLADDGKTGTVELDVELKNLTGDPEDRKVQFELINNQTKKTVLSKTENVQSGKTEIKAELSNPDRWHVESPNLYTALITLMNGNHVEEVIRQDVGFRKLTWDEEGNTYLNGKRYMIRGVNAHDSSDRTGRTLSYAEMLKDVQTMRALNINSLRMSHYPKDVRYYALCNRYGIAVLDENNMESHTFENMYEDPEVEPKYIQQALFRMNNMVQRDKNQPCVIIWSLGNEQFPHDVEEVRTIKEMYDATKRTDPTRPIFCERTFSRKKDKNFAPFIEFIAPMYGGFNEYERWHKSGQDRRPFFMCEYAHAMGNTLANLKGLWETFEQKPGMNGGCIWDFVDQAILMKLPGLEGEHWTYGGDWGAYGTDGVFCMNGVVLPDRSLTGKSYEVRAVYQQLEFNQTDVLGTVRLKNKFATRNLNEFDFRWTLLENGKDVETGSAEVDLAPLTEKDFVVPSRYELKDEKRYDINFDVKLKSDEFRWKKASFVAAGQIPLRAKPENLRPEVMPKTSAPKLVKGKMLVVECDSGQRIAFDPVAGVLQQITLMGKDILKPQDDLPGIEFNPNMCLVDDRTVWQSPQQNSDLAAGLNKLTRKNVIIKEIDSPSGTVRVESVCDYLVKDENRGLRHTAVYTVMPDGTIQVDNDVRKLGLPDNSTRFRIGVRIPVMKEFDSVEYAGLGPYENYDARKTSVRYGYYKAKAGSMYERYVRPQECGNRSGLDWVSLRNEQGLGLMIVADKPGNGSVMPHTAQEMDAVRHQTELPENERWILRYDAFMAPLKQQANIDFANQIQFSYSIRPLKKGDKAEVVAARILPEMKVKIPKVENVVVDGESMELNWISEKASVEYSSISKQWTAYPDTLLTTQESPFAFHTDTENNPWLIIDLGLQQSIRALKIINRGDPSGMDRAKNLHIWVSNDKQTWSEVFQTVKPEKEWTISVNPAQTARYVKIGLVCDQEVFNLRGVRIYGE